MISNLLCVLLGAALCATFPALKSWLRLLPKRSRHRRKIVIWTHEPMSEEQLRNALASVTMENPLLRAILQVIQENLDNAVSEVGAIGIANQPGALAHTAGGVEWLQFLQGDLADLMTGDQRRQFKPSAAGSPGSRAARPGDEE